MGSGQSAFPGQHWFLRVNRACPEVRTRGEEQAFDELVCGAIGDERMRSVANVSAAGAVGERVDTKAARRRLVTYSSLTQFAADLEKVEEAHRAGTLRRLGNREPGPIFGHLAISMRGSREGMPELKAAAPWWLRLVGPLVKGRVLKSPLQPGVRMSSRAEDALWDDGLTFEEGMIALRAEVERAGKPGCVYGAAHPVFGKMSTEEWSVFHLRHAELHMSFLQP